MGSSEKLRVGDQELLPEEISALILKHIKKYAEQYLKEEVDRVVITIQPISMTRQKVLQKKPANWLG